ncbi:transporter family protein [Sporohalobacter salinus]|nr:transporter family protein [Sporohalobacter salinus]
MAIRSFIISGLLLIYGVATGEFSGINEIGTYPLLYIAAEGIFASLLGHLAYFYALKFGAASQVVPFVAAYPLVTVIAAILFLKEGFSWENLIGVLLIIIGIFIIKR